MKGEVVSDQRPTAAEFEQRIQIVETLIILGRAQTLDQVIIGLEATGRIGLAQSTVSKYLQIARKRLLETDEDLAKARREMVFRSMFQCFNDLRKALREHNVPPSWKDLIEMERLMRDVYLAPEEVHMKETITPSEEEDEQNKKRLDSILVEMLDRSKEQIEELGEEVVLVAPPLPPEV